MKKSRRIGLYVCLILGCFTLAGCGYDVRFESSDGLWQDVAIYRLDSRSFYAVVWDFEAYKYHKDDPTLTLVRVTPRPSFYLGLNPFHPSLHFKPLGKPNWSIRIGDHFRAIGKFSGDSFLWEWIGSHGDYDKRF